MKYFKIYIALLCCFTMICFPCRAETLFPCFEVSATDDNIAINDTVYLLIDLKNNVGFGALQFCITYDEDKLLLESTTSGELISDGVITSVNTDITGEINFSAISIQNITGSGTVLVSKFKAKDAGKIKFDFKLLAYADNNGVNLDSTFNDVEIVIEDPEKNDTPGYDQTPENTPSPIRPGGSSHHNNSTGSASADKKEEDVSETEEIQQVPEKKPTFSFTDVTDSHWAYNQIYKTAQMGLFSGTGENTFSPDLPMTRAMFVTVLHRYAGSPDTERADFVDIEDSWYTDAVSWAAKNNIVSGTGDGSFSPHRYITRGEIATIFFRFKKGKSMDMNSADTFNDSDKIPVWGKEPVAWAVEQGLIMGREGGIIAFSDNATRAETAVIFTRFLNIR